MWNQTGNVSGTIEWLSPQTCATCQRSPACVSGTSPAGTTTTARESANSSSTVDAEAMATGLTSRKTASLCVLHDLFPLK